MESEGHIPLERCMSVGDGAGKRMIQVVSSNYSVNTAPIPPPSRKQAAFPPPSRKRKGNADSIVFFSAYMDLLSDAVKLRNELMKCRREGTTAYELIRSRNEGFDLNSSECQQLLQSISMIRKSMSSLCDSLEANFEEQKLNFRLFVENNRQYVDRLLEDMKKSKPKIVRQFPTIAEHEGSSFKIVSESCSLADDGAKVEAMDVETSAMEEQALGMVSGVTLEMETEILAPDTNADVEEELGLNIPMFDSGGFGLPADPTATNEVTAELDEMDRGKSPIQLADEATEIAAEEKNFTAYTNLWKSHRGSSGCGSFCDMTALSSMQLAHLIPGGVRSDYGQVCTTLQVYSIKLSEIRGGLQWPLRVYGVVAVRDAVDHNRNLLFARGNSACQIVKADDPYLWLIGPSRAIVLDDPVVIEIQLKLGASQISRDRPLITGTRRYSVGSGTISFENCFCTTELRVEAIEHSVQATILGVCVKERPWPSEFGGIVYCLAPPLDETCQEDQKVVLLDSRRRRMPTGLDGHLHLSRHVVSVELKSSLTFVLRTYSSPSGNMDECATVRFSPKYSSTSQQTCYLGGTEVEITVAWSRLVVEKQNIELKGWVLDD